MQELEKIPEEIEQRVDYYREHAAFEYVDVCAGLREAQDIIRKHMNGDKCAECSRRKWYQQGYKDGRKDNDGWIPVDERLPEDDSMVLVTCKTKKGALSVNRAYCDGEFWHGSGSMSGVIAWQPLPEPYHTERSTKE